MLEWQRTADFSRTPLFLWTSLCVGRSTPLLPTPECNSERASHEVHYLVVHYSKLVGKLHGRDLGRCGVGLSSNVSVSDSQGQSSTRVRCFGATALIVSMGLATRAEKALSSLWTTAAVAVDVCPRLLAPLASKEAKRWLVALVHWHVRASCFGCAL